MIHSLVCYCFFYLHSIGSLELFFGIVDENPGGLINADICVLMMLSVDVAYCRHYPSAYRISEELPTEFQ